MLEVGQIVKYKLSQTDIDRAAKAPFHHQSYMGDMVPLIIVRIWPVEFGIDKPGINGQAVLDGEGSLWITSVGEGDAPGEWRR